MTNGGGGREGYWVIWKGYWVSRERNWVGIGWVRRKRDRVRI